MPRTRKRQASDAGVQPLTYLRAVLDDPDLSSAERLVAVAIMRHAGPGGRKSHPGVKKLVAETHLNKKTITTACRHLEEKKWLLLTYSGKGGDHGKSNEYDLNIPSASQGSSNGSLGEESQGYSFTSQGSPFSPQGYSNGSTDAFRNAPGDAPSSSANADADDAVHPATPEEPPGDGYTPGETVAGLKRHFPEWEIRPNLLTGQIKRVASDKAVPAEVVCQAVEWWVISAVLGQPDWGLPRRLDKVPDRNPAGWLYNMMPDLVSAYVEARAKKAAELGVDPAGFDYCGWLDDQHNLRS